MNIKKPERIIKIQKGDIKEFEFFFRELYEPLLRYANSIINNENDSEEIVQDIFLNLWKNRKNIKITTSLSAYVYRSVYNNCLQLIKRQKLNIKYKQYAMSQINQPLEPIEELKYNELNKKVFEVLNKLPDNCQTIFKLSRFQGLKYREIAKKLSISIKTVEANMNKALKHFRENM
ncbi:MAG: RNA polymerase sigma-70 factor, partial [Bacteroidales bacterium]|nr:RNA polymerase sigma-70 factor [Bacteroidales bacterium]